MSVLQESLEQFGYHSNKTQKVSIIFQITNRTVTYVRGKCKMDLSASLLYST